MSKRRDIDYDALRASLLARREELASEDDQTRTDRDPVELDQTAVGRLSRMDAMQLQAMAQASHERRLLELARIDAALKRLDDGEYGHCLACDAKIPAKRLELDPASPNCIKCAEAAEYQHAHPH